MILVTGGAGFIGSNIVARLLASGRDVAVCDTPNDGPKARNIAKASLADVLPPEDLFPWLDAHRGRLTGIVHMGAVTSTTETDADLILRQNYALPQQLWTFCTQHTLPLIYASSAATYGGGEHGFDDDLSNAALTKLRPLNPYGLSKLLFDRFVAGEVERGASTPPQWVGLRFFNVYGPNEYHKGAMMSVVAKLHPLAAAGQTVSLFRSHRPDVPDGGQRRDFIYVRDCADVVAWLLDTPRVSGLFNLGTGKARSFLDLANAVFAAVKRQPSIQYIDMPENIRGQYQYFTQANMSRLRAAGYDRPFTSLEDGVFDYVTKFLGTNDPYA